MADISTGPVSTTLYSAVGDLLRLACSRLLVTRVYGSGARPALFEKKLAAIGKYAAVKVTTFLLFPPFVVRRDILVLL
jgi:hypothetical protein